jgi:hypothetical protein
VPSPTPKINTTLLRVRQARHPNNVLLILMPTVDDGMGCSHTERIAH